jgi:hypothetical protein
LAASCGNEIRENAKKFPTRRIYCEKNNQKPACQVDLSEGIALRKEDYDKNEDVFIIRRILSTIEGRVRNGPAIDFHCIFKFLTIPNAPSPITHERFLYLQTPSQINPGGLIFLNFPRS